jgi:hypothetical protein
MTSYEQMRQRVAELQAHEKAEQDRQKLDAERYRWLCSDGKLSEFTALFYNINNQKELDAAIDAAMKANP